jgi:pSer/pThr/pTyr-binding forkhead associated (FHA) protein
MALDSAAALAGLSAIAPAGASPTEVVLGRDPAATSVAIDNPVVSGRHARITRQRPSGLLLEDLGSTNGTFVNGQRISRQTISLADDVRLGSVPVPLSDSRIAGMLLRVTARPVPGQPIVVGSSPTATLVIDDPDVAPQHTQLLETPEGIWLVRDLGGPTGTFVDNANNRIREARVPATGLLLLGRFVLPLHVVARMSRERSRTSTALSSTSGALRRTSSSSRTRPSLSGTRGCSATPTDRCSSRTSDRPMGPSSMASGSVRGARWRGRANASRSAASSSSSERTDASRAPVARGCASTSWVSA